MTKLLDPKRERLIITVISLIFICWSAIFIFRTSFIAIDGKRYFCLFDDAMISMRYAWNFSHGLGLVWNPGEYVQGYTNFLMTLIMSMATAIFNKSNTILMIQILGIGFILGIAFVTIKITGHVIHTDDPQRKVLIRILSFFGVLAYYPLIYWTLMGMETGLLTLLIMLGILFAFAYTIRWRSSYLYFMTGSLSLALLTRNDSLIFTFFIWLYILLQIKEAHPRRKYFQQLLVAISVYFLIMVGQLGFQYLYYGDFLPNTYTLKLTGLPLLSRMADGFRFVIPFLGSTFLLLSVATMETIFRFSRQKLLLLLVIFSSIGYQIYVGGDPWNYWRIMAPTWPLLAILFISGLNSIEVKISTSENSFFLSEGTKRFTEKHTPKFVVILAICGLTIANWRFLPEISLLRDAYSVNANISNVNTAIVLNQLTTDEATIGVYWAGSIPYFTDKYAIDFLGKSDRYIANLDPDITGSISWSGMRSVPGHNKYDLNYSIKILKPVYIQGLQWGTQDLTQWAKTHYVLVEHDGVQLYLQTNSPTVLWDRITNIEPIN